MAEEDARVVVCSRDACGGEGRVWREGAQGGGSKRAESINDAVTLEGLLARVDKLWR